MASFIRFARLAVASALAAGLLGAVSAAPVAAHTSVGWVVVHVTDCQTGQPIQSGQAEFSVIHQFAVGVAPIVDGVAGPIGLGGNHYKLYIVVPGYHTLTRVLWGDGDFSTTTTLEYCLHPQ